MSASHRIGRSLTKLLQWPDAPWDSVQIAETPTALSTWMPIADMAAAAQGMLGLAAAAVHHQRGGTMQRIGVDRAEASLSTTAAAYLTIDGKRAVEWDPLTGYFQAADGWVYLHTAFPHLRAGLLQEFGFSEDRDAVAKGLLKLTAQEIEDRAATAGVCAIRRRSRAEWDAHTHAAALSARPVINMTRTDGPKGRVIPKGDAPLSGIKVLDLSRVIAGPTIGRCLAEHGAQVLRVGAAHLPAIDSLVVDTGHGKRTAFADLRSKPDLAAFRALVRDADILIDGYRPGALAGLGLGREDLARLNPGLIQVSLSAFGETGPWGGRRGYDTYVQAATGLTQDGPDGPVRLPCQPLDYLTGYFGAASAMIALAHRMRQGGGWHIDLALARTAMWIWEWTDQLPPEAEAPASNPSIDEVANWCVTVPSDFGLVSSLRPAVRLSQTPAYWRHAPRRLGSDQLVWDG